jgi:phosphoglycerol transferase MdoB-like AlkP superfamily enzyme
MFNYKDDKNKVSFSKQAWYAFLAFVILNAIKLSFFNYSMIPEKSAGMLGYKLGFFFLVSSLFFLIILRFRSRYVYLVMYIIESIYVFSLLSYFGYFHNYLHIMQSFVLFTEGVESVGHMTMPVGPTHLLILVDTLPFIFIFKNYKALHSSFRDISKRLLKYSVIAMAAFLLISEGFYASKGLGIKVLCKDYTTYEDVFVERFGTLASDSFNTVLNNGGESYIKHIQYGEEIKNTQTADKEYNIIAIQVESMDSSIVNQTWEGSYVTPYLHSLTESAVYYPYTLSYHMAGGTSDAEFSVLNGVEPLSIFPSMKLSKYNYPNSVAKQFHNAGYATYAFHGNIGNYYNRDVSFDKMGFDEFYDINDMEYKDTSGWGVPDHLMFNYALDKLKNVDGHFFSYIITITSHMPFNNTSSYYSASQFNTVKNATVRDYFTSFSYVDQSIKEFVDEVQKTHPDTYIFIYGDHTPDVKAAEYTQSSYEYEGNYYEFVPMFVITPDRQSKAENTYPASFLDVAPTMLEVSGIAFNFKSSGINLVDSPSKIPELPYKDGLYNRSSLLQYIPNR